MELIKSPVFTTVAIGLGTVFISRILYRLYRRRKLQRKLDSFPKDLVILHQFSRGRRAPSPSPFPLKLETWLRMANIKYQNDYTMELSPKGKIPWISFNQEIIADSEFCISYLKNKYNVDLSSHLSPVDKAIARAFLKLNEESLRWCGVIHRFKYGKAEDIGIPEIIFKIVGRKMLKETEAQGYGKHSKEEVYQIVFEDMRAIETFLGDKKFLFGDQVCNEDASLFGMMAQIVNHDRGPGHKFFMSECPNSLRYYNTMKETFWPDWNDVIREKPGK